MFGMRSYPTVTYQQTSTVVTTTVQGRSNFQHRHPAVFAALRGAAVGAVAGIALPLLSPLSGAVAGAAVGYALYARRHAGSVNGSSAYYNSGIVPPWLGGYRPAPFVYAPQLVSPYDGGWGVPFSWMGY